jgi:hypothetical protein
MVAFAAVGIAAVERAGIEVVAVLDGVGRTIVVVIAQ